jgi:predicted DNA-binding transcriptional regulator AlpA
MNEPGGIDVHALAEAVADVLEERGLLDLRLKMPGAVLSVADVAELLGRSRAWVYEHSAELGVFRFGSGPKARLGFDRDAIERWKRDRHAPQGRPSPPPRRRRSRRPPASPDVGLIPYDPIPFRA